MKKFIFSIVTIFISSSLFFNLCANNFDSETEHDNKQKDFKLSIQPQTEFATGKLGEYLFTDKSHNSLKSYLEWQTNYLFGTGIKAEGKFNNLELSLGFNYFLPLECGNMLDKDWKGDLQTNLGSFSNTAKNNFDINLEAQYIIEFNNKVKFKPTIIFYYASDNFVADKGIGLYGTKEYSLNGKDVNYDSEYARPVKLYNIEYRRFSLFNFAGGNIEFTAGKFTVVPGFFISPFCILDSLDYHTDNGKHEQDYKMHIQNINFLGAGRFDFDLHYAINSRVKITAGASFIFTPELTANAKSDYYRRIISTDEGIKEIIWTNLGMVSASDFYRFTVNAGCKINF